GRLSRALTESKCAACPSHAVITAAPPRVASQRRPFAIVRSGIQLWGSVSAFDGSRVMRTIAFVAGFSACSPATVPTQIVPSDVAATDSTVLLASDAALFGS